MGQKKRTIIRGILLVCVVSMLLIGVLLLHLWEQHAPYADMETEAAATTEAALQVKENLTTILIMGLDKYQAPLDAMGYLNDQQADFLMLAVLDRDAKVCDVLHLNRDTMTEIRRLGIGSKEAGRFVGQLALAHTYGSGGSDSCLNTVRAVSDLLKGVKIDHYLAVTMDGVGALNDLVGGVTVEVLDDMTDFDPALVKGQTVTLHGDQALLYVRTRAGLADSTNLHRMERQRQYLSALYSRIMEKLREDENFLTGSLTQLAGCFKSDCTVNQLNDLGKLLSECTLHPFLTLEGEAVKGEEFIEYYVDPDSLTATLRKLFTVQ